MRVVIVGAGVVGLAAAWEFLRAGHEVVVLDAASYGEGPSHGNAALATWVLSFPVPAPGTISVAAKSLLTGNQAISVRPGFSKGYLAFLAEMAWATTKRRFVVGTNAQDILSRMVVDGFSEYRDAGLDYEQHEQGSMHVFSSREALDAAVAVFDGFPDIRSRIKVLIGSEAVHEVDPNLAPEVAFAYFAPGDLQVEPDSLMKALVGSITAAGGELHEGAAVTDFAKASEAVTQVVTTAATYDADQVIIAAGVGSRAVCKSLGVGLPLFSGGGYSVDIHFDDAAGPATSVMTDTTHIAVTPLDWGLRASSGMIIGQKSPATVSTETINRLLHDLLAIYPDVPLEGVQPGWAGLRPMSADGVPIIGRLGGWNNVWVASGHAMLGLTYAPATAKVLRALVEGTAPAEYEAFSASRFKVAW